MKLRWWLILCLLSAGCHKHHWQLVESTYLAPIANFHAECTFCTSNEWEDMKRLSAGSTTMVFRCWDCGAIKQVVTLGKARKEGCH